jgi:hypothetical protein
MYEVRCGADEETSALALCERKALVALRHSYLGSFYLDPEDVRNHIWEQSGTLVKVQGSHDLYIRYNRTRLKDPVTLVPRGLEPVHYSH